jgi:translation elongation factor aEF-1 beta
MSKKLQFAKSPVREMMKKNGAQLVAKDAVDLLIDHIEQAANQLTRMSIMYAMHAKRKKITRDDVLLAIKYTTIKHQMKAEKYVIAVIKVLPDDVMSDTELDALVEDLKRVIRPLNSVIEKTEPVPIAFGLRALSVRLRIPEKTVGGTQPIEDAMQSLENVQRVECEMVSRPMQPKDISQF